MASDSKPQVMQSLVLPLRREFLVDQVAALLRQEIAATRPDEHHSVVPRFVAGASVGAAPVAT